MSAPIRRPSAWNNLASLKTELLTIRAYVDAALPAIVAHIDGVVDRIDLGLLVEMAGDAGQLECALAPRCTVPLKLAAQEWGVALETARRRACIELKPKGLAEQRQRRWYVSHAVLPLRAVV